MQRRHALLAATAALSGFTGCIAPFTSSGFLKEVSVKLWNADDRARTFHLALETEAGMLDWESHHIDAGADELVTIAPDEDVSPVALHGAVEDFAGSVDVLGVDDLDEDYCLQFDFSYLHPTDKRPQLAMIADIECEP
ncbi:hypothetical protein KU306_16515 (plasmid) [Haloferax larsenii]|uniref:Lipoprotein n=1 Tax=Haloferax larsenii TaxID=302484 RepID=A0ABY5RJ81_HALLR|nr:hypothetical protein [Haloferax larsenii]UVE52209.1 hypothetical protein KU306_16515 [Haloferax larsenii]